MIIDAMMFLIVGAGFVLTLIYMNAEFRAWRRGTAESRRRQMLYGQLHATRVASRAHIVRVQDDGWQTGEHQAPEGERDRDPTSETPVRPPERDRRLAEHPGKNPRLPPLAERHN